LGSELVRELSVVDGRQNFIAAVSSAAEKVINEAISARGTAHVVLTGGTMGIAVLTGFGCGQAARVDWSKVHFWWGDERYVAQESADRNAIQARRAFLDFAAVPESHIHEMPASDSGLTLDEAAAAYAATLSASAGAALLPHFDLTFLGIGPDSHVASLFPDHPDALTSGLCVPVRNSPKPPPERVSLTFDAINTSDRVWVVACGSDKAQAVAEMFAHENNRSFPSSCVRGAGQTKLWADCAAAEFLDSFASA
jgi:6-phosphogluconolactonase